MRWLVTARAESPVADIVATLEEIGCHDIDTSTITPVDGEVVVSVEGPDDLERRALSQPSLTGVFNDSEQTLL